MSKGEIKDLAASMYRIYSKRLAIGTRRGTCH